MTQLTATGFLRSRLDERLAELQAKMQDIFGPDISIEADDIDGEVLGIYAEAMSDLDQLAEHVYASLNPQTATGVALSRGVQWNGIKRIGGGYSTVTVTCGGTQNTVIPAGSLVKDPNTGATFATLADVTIPSAGIVTVAAQATTLGAISAPIGSLTKIDTPIYGWQTVTNAVAATLGRDEETDEQLRIRRRLSTAKPGQSNIDAIYGEVANVTGVTSLKVYDNKTNAVDANGLPAGNIYVVAEGGADQDIADAIFRKAPGGVPLYGSHSGTSLDSTGTAQPVNWGRPIGTNIYVVVNMHSKAGWPTDGAQQIKDAIVEWAAANQGIGQEVVQSHLYTPVNTVPGSSIDSIYIGIAANPTTTANVAIAFDHKASFDTSRITVNVS